MVSLDSNQTPDSRHQVQARRPSTAPRRNICVYCPRIFKRTEHLQRHIRTHTKDKPYICHCSTAFARRDLLTRYERLAHGHNSSYLREQASADYQVPADDPTGQSLTEATSTVGVSTTDWITPISEKSTEGQWPRQDQVVGEFQHNAPDDAPDTTSQTVKPTHTASVERVIELHPQFMPRNDGDTCNPSSIEEPYALFNDDPNHFQEFASFLDSIGLPAEWTPPDFRHEFDTSEANTESHEKRKSNNHLVKNDESCPGSPFGSWPPSVPQGDQPLNSLSDKG